MDGGAGADPSMEDILASIRRILNEDEVTPPSPEAGAPDAPGEPPVEPHAGGTGGDEEDGVLVLDEAMLVTAPEPAVPQPGSDIATPTAGGFDPPPMFPLPIAVPVAPSEPDPVAVVPPPPPTPWPDAAAGSLVAADTGPGLLAPESEAAAASSVGALLRTISQERSSQVHRGGPTIEDLVREEIRPLLKYWLDTHLPPLVERLVRQEIERVTGRAAP
jgi:cell pole-organizing protein PopZ